MKILIFKLIGGDLGNNSPPAENIDEQQMYAHHGFTPEQIAYGKQLLKECADKFYQSLPKKKAV